MVRTSHPPATWRERACPARAPTSRARGRYARRGWAGGALSALSAEETAYQTLPPKALVLVVHGIGESLWSTKQA